MVKYFIDVRVAGLENVYAFISMQEVQFHAREASFEYDVLVPTDCNDTYLWVSRVYAKGKKIVFKHIN